MDLFIFEKNKPFVLAALENGQFDYVDAASEVFETDFFRYIHAQSILAKCAQTYPTPRKKQEVPLSLFIASNLSMRLHGVHAFHAFPMVVRVGGMLNALGPSGGQKVTHPETSDVTLFCEGFNQKNHYDRQTPCDQDTLRKLAKDTDSAALLDWYNHEVVQIFRSKRAYDKEGLFIGDASYLFVPDNPNYEGSVTLRFDEHNHPVSKKAYEKMTAAQKDRCQWRRCYKMVTLIHTNRKLEYFLFVGVQVVSGMASECPILYEIVDQFAEAVGTGVMKRLILDRGFLDGTKISRCKKDYGIDVLIPVRRNMDIYKDAEALFQLPQVRWTTFEQAARKADQEPLTSRRRPQAVEKREKARQKTLDRLAQNQPPPAPDKVVVKTETAAIGDFTSWSSCTVPLTVVANREYYADGHEQTWYLLDTRGVCHAEHSRQDYALRTCIEERYRQLKCFSDLAAFTSRAFSLIVNQVIFTLLAYSLLQLFLLRQGRKELNNKPTPKIREQLLPSNHHIIVYFQNYYGLFEQLEFMELMTVGLSDEARKKIGDKSRRLRREFKGIMTHPRPT